MPKSDSPFDRAFQYASIRHKPTSALPLELQTMHPIHAAETAALIQFALKKADTNLMIAALLHSAVETSEDRGTILSEIRCFFGDDIGGLVAVIAKDMSLSDDENHERVMEWLPDASDRLKTLKMADTVQTLETLLKYARKDLNGDQIVSDNGFAHILNKELAHGREIMVTCAGVNEMLSKRFAEVEKKAALILKPSPPAAPGANGP